MRLFRIAATMLAFLVIAGCISPYKVEVRQGNVVTPEMLEKLKPGLTKSQVRFVLGTPLITDPFHQERWDYVYVYKKHARAPAETRHLTVIFNGDTLARIEGDLAPTATAGDASREDSAPAADPSPDASNGSVRAL